MSDTYHRYRAMRVALMARYRSGLCLLIYCLKEGFPIPKGLLPTLLVLLTTRMSRRE